MNDLRLRLQQSLGDSYRIERELGGGGMSRVFLAEEVRLGRDVVIKVLPPEMGAGVNIERFEREIRLAAKLQHPHIVPLLTAGSAGDLLYYVMPFIEGESLRAKLAREGELPVHEALRIVREVADALQHAHAHRVVHRDIKPDNVLLTGAHALVTDFGVAKAVSESTGEQSLTSLGVALGTPAYMAPEQAAAEPHVDHRADIYALGAMCYEMLAGRPPFTGPSAQAVLAAHITQTPDPVTRHRESVPQALSELILRCLQKKPADRWQRVDEILQHLDALLTLSVGMTLTGTQPVVSSGTEAAIRRSHPLRVAGLSAIAAVGVLAIVYALMLALGLPDWVFVGAVGLVAVGVPLALLTGHHERRRAVARSEGRLTTTPPSGITPHFTWRKALAGGGIGFGGLGVLAAGYMGMRAFGIGPAATTISSGELAEGDVVVLARFENRAADSLLGLTVTEALRVDLAQSSAITLMAADVLAEALRRMGVEDGATLGEPLARDLALREGAKAVVAGDINVAGQGYVLGARLVVPDDGRVLVAVRETASDDAQVVPAIDRLSKSLRERLGESLRTIRASPPLAQVTTASLDALRAYTEGVWIYQTEGDLDKALPYWEEAIRLDSTFAAAYRKMGQYLRNNGRDPALWRSAMTRAFEFREREAEEERYLAEGTYYARVLGDFPRAIASLEAYRRRFPQSVGTVHNNLGSYYNITRQFHKAEPLLAEFAAKPGGGVEKHGNLAAVRWALGDSAGAAAAIARLAERYPDNPTSQYQRAVLAFQSGNDGRADSLIRDLRASRGPAQRVFTSWWLSQLSRFRGKMRDAERWQRDQIQALGANGLPGAALTNAIDLAWQELIFRGDTAGAVRLADSLLDRWPLDSIPLMERPYLQLAGFYAAARASARARQYQNRYLELMPKDVQETQPYRHVASGAVAKAEGNPTGLIDGVRRADAEYWCELCVFNLLGLEYAALDEPDSAIAYLEKYVETPRWYAPALDAWNRARAYQSLGELYERRGDRTKAMDYYARFADLWNDADAELQPLVREVRRRIERLVREGSGQRR